MMNFIIILLKDVVINYIPIIRMKLVAVKVLMAHALELHFVMNDQKCYPANRDVRLVNGHENPWYCLCPNSV